MENPQLSGSREESASVNKKAEHDTRCRRSPRAASGPYRPGSTVKDCQLDRTRIEFPSVDAWQRAGIQVVSAREQPLPATVMAPGEIDFDRPLASPVSGRVWRVEMEVGERVRKEMSWRLLLGSERSKPTSFRR